MRYPQYFICALTVSCFTDCTAVWSYVNIVKCKYYECCSDKWIATNLTGLTYSLETELHGQHLVQRAITNILVGHLKNKNPEKALVMSFHGWTGSGKSHVSKLIVQNLFKKGMQSNYVKLYIAPLHFPHEDHVQQYKQTLQKEIAEQVKKCERSLFIFEEMHLMPKGLIDALNPYIDYHIQVDGVDFRKATFLFLSNTGGNAITQETYKSLLDGKDRNDITFKDMERLINIGAFNEIGGFQKSDIVRNHLIDMYVPFLPLEKKHIKLCVRDALLSLHHNLDEGIINSVADELEYFPEEFQLFSVSGCKKIAQKVHNYIYN